MRHYPKLLAEFVARSRDCDLVLVGFYGQLLMPFVRMFTRKPILFDVYVSTFGTMVDDRHEAKQGTWKAKLFWAADHLSMRFANHIILESEDHIRRYESTYRIPARKFSRLFLPSDESVMRRLPQAQPSADFRVHFHGEYAPFHGVDVILRAAKALEKDDVRFQIIGTGITHAREMRLATELGLSNVEFIDRVRYDELAIYMSKADVCLGFFGDNPRAERVFTNKVVEALALGKPLITRRNDAVQELLKDGESALLVNPGRPDQLADAILRLKNDPGLREKLGRNALALFEAHCTQEVFGMALKRVIEEMLTHAG
jgi:glycosyltransferase involved in cell wall biosynthesis